MARGYVFAPTVDSRNIRVQLLADSRDGQIQGLYSDVSTPPNRYLRDIGVLLSPPPRTHGASRRHSSQTCTVSAAAITNPLPGASSWGHFCTQATLESATSFTVFSWPGRCFGVMINYDDGRQDYIGRWHANTARQETFSLSAGSAIRFGFRGRSRFVSFVEPADHDEADYDLDRVVEARYGVSCRLPWLGQVFKCLRK
ncbi:hypothetical protein BO70DRAFT_194502 [Aspergillus heteromorphus CBS 117.55]|uniref:Uncharacterized protein n=1 Tax=Aspergillus heteromorphus CBS 117.55 TaxID=1448321 RepID=A0A317WN34_9EURO|nr:uncharacterized protein BO70DRAFT_194502 [Aspergillus heteromorphus CBS 117.55]PWY87445.1 hypothetical protein BO70DRAFT_194502 [Aspergillus heteromorphus CBS 117.55]